MEQKQRVPLYDRLPEIYRIKDGEQNPPGQLKSYLALVESVFSEIHKNIEDLYHDFFIDTCDDWVVPYIGDLLGVSHLKGDPASLRADVAETIALRRRKGTLAGMERLVYNLTRWGVHCVELRENLVWNQHLNHQRPHRGGTVTLRDPAMLSLLDTPFDPFAHTADIKPPAFGNTRYNLPNLAIFLWRLYDYRVVGSRPLPPSPNPVHDNASASGDQAPFIACFNVHPLGEPVRLFNTYQFDPDTEPPVVTRLDETPGPILTARLIEDSPAGAPWKYVSVDTYDETGAIPGKMDIADTGFQLFLPGSVFTSDGWSIRGANLCAWESGILPPVDKKEIVIDPVTGRFVIGVETKAQGDALIEFLLIAYTYGAVGPVGAHPVSRSSVPSVLHGEKVKIIDVTYKNGKDELKEALDKIEGPAGTFSAAVIRIRDSMTYQLDIKQVNSSLIEDDGGILSLRLRKSLEIRAGDDQRPVIKLIRPLRFRPHDVTEAGGLDVRLEGLYLTRGDNWDTDFSAPQKEPLVARAAVNRLDIDNCTLDPGGYEQLDNTRAPIYTSIYFNAGYDFTDAGDRKDFGQIPNIVIRRSIVGPLYIDTDYTLSLTVSIIDAGKGVGEVPGDTFALSGTGDPVKTWGPPTRFDGITVFGRMRVEQAGGKGGIFVHALEVLQHQSGCIKFSYFPGIGDRLPQNHGCVFGTDARLRFVSEIFGRSAYGQLHRTADFRIRERGPGDDAMGAFGFLMEAHKWRNLSIRFREFMPVGVRPILIPVT